MNVNELSFCFRNLNPLCKLALYIARVDHLYHSNSRYCADCTGPDPIHLTTAFYSIYDGKGTNEYSVENATAYHRKLTDRELFGPASA